MMEENNILIVLDVETTGLDYKREKIIEFAALKLVDNKIVDEYEVLIDPKQDIRQSSMNIHGITPEMLEGKPTMQEVLPKILEFIGDYPLVAHNVIFDYSFLNQACSELYGTSLKNKKIDTQQLYKEVFPDEPSHGLLALLERFYIKPDVRHRAMADARGLALAYPYLKDLYDQKHDWQLSQVNNVNYLFERYLRIQQSIQTLQAELFDIKSVFKVYFEEGGNDIEATTGEVLTCTSRIQYAYEFEQIKDVLEQIGAFNRAVKLNNGLIDRMVNGTSLDDDIKEKLSQARVQVNESRSIVVQKPEKNIF